MKNILSRSVATLVFSIIVAVALSGKSDTLAEKYIDNAFQRALATFAVARGTNAVISALQGTELAFEPVGVGVTTTPGELLDPINDLIERFSWVMLLATASLGIQKILAAASMSLTLQVAVIGSVAIGVLLVWLPKLIPSVAWRSFLLRLIALTLFVRFAVPGISLLNHAAYEAFLSKSYEISLKKLETAKEGLEATENATNATDHKDDRGKFQAGEPCEGFSWISEIGSWKKCFSVWLESRKEQLNFEKRFSDLKENIDKAVEHIINLIAVFILTTIVFPLLFLFLGLRVLSIFGDVRWWKETKP